MKKIIVLFFSVTFSLSLNAQKKNTAQDSIKIFYDVLFKNLKKQFIFKKTVDWKTVQSETKQHLSKYTNFQNSLDETKVLFDRIGAVHGHVYYKDKEYSSSVKTPVKADFSDQWIKKYATKPSFETKIIDGKYGYILVPEMMFMDTSSENIHKIAQPLYDQIVDLKAKNNLEGWIIDLRFNTGGNATPMLLTLYDFLGNNEIWGIMDVNKKLVGKYKLDQGNYGFGKIIYSSINPKGELLDHAKVAVITGIVTGSSGEVTALAFKGRSKTVFIGDNTFGFTTGNIKLEMPFGAYFALTTGYDSDRNGVFYERIIPDIRIVKQDNFDDLLLDKNVQEAIKYFTNKEL